MKRNLNKLIKKLKSIKGERFDLIIKDINQANQVKIALERAGYNAYGFSDWVEEFSTTMKQVKAYCVAIEEPIIFTTFEDHDYMVTNITNFNNPSIKL